MNSEAAARRRRRESKLMTPSGARRPSCRRDYRALYRIYGSYKAAIHRAIVLCDLAGRPTSLPELLAVTGWDWGTVLGRVSELANDPDVEVYYAHYMDGRQSVNGGATRPLVTVPPVNPQFELFN